MVDGNKVVAIGRVFGDNSMSYFIKDVVVIPEYRGKGSEKLLINDK
ncbi:putative GNAT family acetyltransferase [Clostridium tetanomorphum]|nr:GNAT family N-acetyltransferase [Clostridium tetanomorphum]KAJ52442.1 acetyltransferase [Clostridium tetanomorphum DSM 665]MBP1864719.1 putative GNAT family acetyltransferase [Clostridium tetanomorphum]NRS83896.1 putative GNAT family acetyltransferase [Clostridium tetanomorphum]